MYPLTSAIISFGVAVKIYWHKTAASKNPLIPTVI